MSIILSDYFTHLSNIVVAPEPKPVVVIPEDKVRFFTPGAGYAPMPTPPMRKISVPEIRDDPFPVGRKSHKVKPEPQAVLAPPEDALAPLNDNPLLWAKQQSAGANAWEIIDQWFKTLTHIDGGNMALEFLLNKTAAVPQAEAELTRLVDRLFMAAMAEIEAYDHAYDRQEDARQNRQKFTWPEDVRRPAQLYRSYTRPLRAAHALGYHVHGAISALAVMQNRPLDELDNPGWVDPYTGEVDPDSDILNIRPLSDVENLVEMVGDPDEIVGHIDVYGPNGKERQPITRAEQYRMLAMEAASLKSAEGFNAEDEEIEWFDDHDPLTPMWQEIAQELSPQNLGELRTEAYPYQKEFSRAIERSLEAARQNATDTLLMEVSSSPMFSEVKEKLLTWACWDTVNYPLKKHPELSSLSYNIYRQFEELVRFLRPSIFENAHNLIRNSVEAQNILDWLQRKANDLESPVDLTLIFSGLQHALGFEEEDAAEVKLVGQYPTLFDFIEENFDEMEELVSNMALGRKGQNTSTEKQADHALARRPVDKRMVKWGDVPANQDNLDKFAKDTIHAIAELSGAEGPEVTHNPAYIEGYLNAMVNAQNVTTNDENGYHNAATEAGWSAWREWKSPDGNMAYQAARKAGKDQKEAMKAFWSMVNRPKVIGIRKDGLTIQSGDKKRQIDWHIAILKVKGNELDLSQEERSRLKAKLLELKIGTQLAGCL